MTLTLASVSLKRVGHNNDSTRTTGRSFGQSNTYLKYKTWINSTNRSYKSCAFSYSNIFLILPVFLQRTSERVIHLGANSPLNPTLKPVYKNYRFNVYCMFYLVNAAPISITTVNLSVTAPKPS